MTSMIKYIVKTPIADIVNDILIYNRICRSLEKHRHNVIFARDRLYSGRVVGEPQIRACITEVFRKQSDRETVVTAFPMFEEECENYNRHYSFCVDCPFLADKKKFNKANYMYKKLEHDRACFWNAKFSRVK